MLPGIWAIILAGCGVGEEVDALRAEKAELESRLAEVEAALAALQAGTATEEELSGLLVEIESVDARVADLEGAGLASEQWVLDQAYARAEDLAELESSTAVGLAAHETRLSTSESTLGAHGTRVTALETASTAHDTAITALGTATLDHGERLDTLEDGQQAHTMALLDHEGALADQHLALAAHEDALVTQGDTLQSHATTLASQSTTLTAHGDTLATHGTTLTAQGDTLASHGATLQAHSDSLAVAEDAAVSRCAEPMLEGCGASPDLPARTCATLHDTDPTLPDGLYWIDPTGAGPWRAWCDMSRDGGGWTLVLQNHRAIPNGNRRLSWSQAVQDVIVRGGTYSDDLGAFDLYVGVARWADIGTEARREMGSTVGVPLRQAFYTLVLDPEDEYRIEMSDLVVTVGEQTPGVYAHHQGRRLSTFDNDNSDTSCAGLYHHPWWYTSCWSGSMWGGTDHEEAPYWSSSSSDQWHEWGALWLR